MAGRYPPRSDLMETPSPQERGLPPPQGTELSARLRRLTVGPGSGFPV